MRNEETCSSIFEIQFYVACCDSVICSCQRAWPVSTWTDDFICIRQDGASRIGARTRKSISNLMSQLDIRSSQDLLKPAASSHCICGGLFIPRKHEGHSCMSVRIQLINNTPIKIRRWEDKGRFYTPHYLADSLRRQIDCVTSPSSPCKTKHSHYKVIRTSPSNIRRSLVLTRTIKKQELALLRLRMWMSEVVFFHICQ